MRVVASQPKSSLFSDLADGPAGPGAQLRTPQPGPPYCSTTMNWCLTSSAATDSGAY